MSCSGCSTGRGSNSASKNLPGGCKNNGSCGTGSCNKLNVFDWLANMELPLNQPVFDCVEIRFKNSRKEFYRNVNNLPLAVGDVVAVEATPGHDMGVVSLHGELVRLQMRKRNVNAASDEIKKIYRKAKQTDIDKWREAQELEKATMYKARTIAVKLNLEMKISDVEYQGDKTKAIFYYTADDRVDFRELIKVLAEEFKVRIEMRQIGARQEASRLGGIGSCGRELCCSTWLTDFRSVSTSAARYQQLSLNPLKLAGQCGKLKCCLNYELDSYLDALKDFPDVNNVKLETKKGKAFHQKTDIFRRMMFFSYTDEPDTFIEVSVDRVKEIMSLNTQGVIPEELIVAETKKPAAIIKTPDYENVVGQDSLTRFDRKKNQKTNNNRGKGRGTPSKNQNQQVKEQKQTAPNQSPLKKQTGNARQQPNQGHNKDGGQRKPNVGGNTNKNQQRNQNQNRKRGNQQKNTTKPDLPNPNQA